MQKLYLLSGLSHSGKSYIADKIAKKINAKIISLDELNSRRGLNSNENISIEEWERTHQIALEGLEKYLKNGKTAIVDDTNPLEKLRMRFKAVADKYAVPTTIIYLDTPDEIIEERMKLSQESKRRHLAPNEALNSLESFYELPTVEETQIITYRYGEDVEHWIEKNFNK